VLTAAVTFGVYQYMLAGSRPEAARTYAFAVLVFAELLRAFGARSESKSVWQLRPRVNGKLVAAVGGSIAFQLWLGHAVTLERVFKTTPMPYADSAVLLALGAIPLVVLEVLKVVRRWRGTSIVQTPTVASPHATTPS
jgi:Ca2+-transporting ATPase